MLRNLVVPCMLDPLPGREVEVDEFQVRLTVVRTRGQKPVRQELPQGSLMCKHRVALPLHVDAVPACSPSRWQGQGGVFGLRRSTTLQMRSRTSRTTPSL